MSEPCTKCGNTNYAVARNMLATRFCKCGNTWDPIHQKQIDSLQSQLTRAQELLDVARNSMTKALDHLEVFNFAKDPTRVAHADTELREALAKIGKPNE